MPNETPPRVDPRNIRISTPAPSPETPSTGTQGPPPPVEFTRFESTDGAALTKRFELDESGRIHKFSQTQLSRGIAERRQLVSVLELPDHLDALTSTQCIGTGVYDVPRCEIVLDAEITDDAVAKGKRSRTKRFLKAPEHALVMFDHDPSEYMPEHLRCRTPDELMAELEQAVPELKPTAYVGSGSSSAGVRKTDTDERYPSSGLHVYISTVGQDPHQLAEIIHVRLWNAGYGYIDLAANGAMLVRSIVDKAVFAPERLIYEAVPLLEAGLARDPRTWTRREGGALLNIAPLTDDERMEYERRVADAMREPDLVRKSDALHAEHHAAQLRRMADKHGISIEQARERMPKPPGGVAGTVQYLPASYVLDVGRDGITFGELNERGAEFHGRSMPDPIEGAVYGTSTAKFYHDPRNGGCIHSLAHGRSTIYLLDDFPTCETVQVTPPPRVFDLAEPLPVEIFPHRSNSGLFGTIQNVRVLLSGYGIRVRYDVVSKRLVISIPGHSGTPDNIDNSTLAAVFSVAALNRLPTGNLPQYLAAIGDSDPVNPVADWIEREPWDGVDRLAPFYATLTTREEFPAELKEILVRRWLISAVAAALMPSGFRCRGVLVLCGPQAIGKGAWIMALIDDLLLRAIALKVDHHLDAASKDSVLGAVSHWIVELAELEGIFKRKDIARLKGFITSDKDKVRRPYDRRESEYQRRTVFVASVNQPDFLVDDTGNTRWWTLPVVAVNYNHGIDMRQLWAQVATLYRAGEQWWLTRDEEELLERHNQQHRSASAIRDAILEQLDFAAPKDRWVRQTARQVLLTLGFEHPTNPLTRECGGILREMFGEPTRSQGNSRWLVPPVQQFGFEKLVPGRSWS